MSHRVRTGRVILLLNTVFFLSVCSGCGFLCELLGIPPESCGTTRSDPIGGASIQDLQVSLEVRFIAVTDDFFDRIGVDFDFDFNSSAQLLASELMAPVAPINPVGHAYLAQATQVGGQENFKILVPKQLDGFTKFLPLLAQGNTTLVTSFTGFPLIRNLPVTNIFQKPDLNEIPGGKVLDTRYGVDAFSLGYAVLSDAELSVFLDAIRAESQNRILAEPTVRTFNEQPCVVLGRNEFTSIDDVTLTFATPALAVDSLLAFMTSGPTAEIVPVISDDRRSVRLDLRPLIAAIAEFPAGEIDGVNKFVQFPVIEPAAVQASVTVPDGGTVILGGFRKSAEGELERGVPILNKVPFIKRLFKNSAPIQDDHLLMVMITPRIVILEEEE